MRQVIGKITHGPNASPMLAINIIAITTKLQSEFLISPYHLLEY